MVRLTKTGTTYVLFTIVIAVAALNTGNNPLYIGLALMLGCLLLSGLASKGGLKHLEVELRSVDQPWAGRPADAILLVRNRSRIWNVRDVLITSAELERPLLIPILPRRSSQELIVSFLFERRGHVTLKTLDSYTRYPFGFFLKKRRLKIEGEVVVFPRLLGDDAIRDRYRPLAGDQTTANRPGPGSDIHGFRDYVRGDSLRQIYWKKSASIGRWITKQTDLDAHRAVQVAVDTYKPISVSEADFEEMVSAAATYIFSANRRGIDVTLTMPRTTLRAREGQPANALFASLATVAPSFEPVHFTLERSAILFSVGRDDEPKSA
ncbi:MAG: DUF58 domain-containing protein [Thermoanaerobaculia bacterium]